MFTLVLSKLSKNRLVAGSSLARITAAALLKKEGGGGGVQDYRQFDSMEWNTSQIINAASAHHFEHIIVTLTHMNKSSDEQTFNSRGREEVCTSFYISASLTGIPPGSVSKQQVNDKEKTTFK